MNYLREDIAAAWQGQEPLAQAFALQGEIFRDVPGRRTMQVEVAGRSYFVKLHYGVGWREVIKNWLQFKRPVVGAENEYLACRGLLQAHIPAPVPAAYGVSAGSIASRQSFVLCEALEKYTSLEDVTEAWHQQPPTPLQKHRLLYAVARFAREFHAQGFIHRDFYICHLLADDSALDQGVVELAVLDLHRARHFAQIPRRWLKRDLAALLFSTLDLGFSRRDWLRFIHLYRQRSVKSVLGDERAFWQSVLARAEKLYRQGRRKQLVKGFYTP